MAAVMHKRKRSMDRRNSSTSFPPTCAAPSSSTTHTIDIDIPSCLNSRTFKRFRDTRPPDKEIHQRTLGLLYSAQQRPQQQQQQPTPSPVQEESPTAAHSSTQTHQQSLHKFWSIHSAPTSATHLNTHTHTHTQALTPPPPTSCEDCGAGFAGGAEEEEEQGGGEGDMDVDAAYSQNDMAACGACGKYVCFSCSVSNLGDEKRCLRCAGKKMDVHGLGWSVPVS